MILQSVWQECFDFLGTKPVVVTPVEAPLSSDAGLLPLRQLDERLGATAQFAAALTDLRQAGSVQHTLLEMVRMRVYGILADYEDQNDHDTLRSDPIFKLVAGRLPDDEDLASQPTLSRFENAVDVRSLFRLRDVLIDQFLAAFDRPPRRLTLDIDTFDDPTHGQQQLSFFHGYYDQYQYQPRAITCAENDRVLMVGLLYGSAHPTLGADDDLEYLVGRLRAVWPDVQFEVRGDSGFGQPSMYAVCERLGIGYTFGLAMNATLKSWSQPLLEQAQVEYAQSGQPQRQFCDFWYRAGSWPARAPRRGQGRGRPAGDQPPGGGHQPAGRDGVARRGLRGLRRSRREREPQQGAEDEPGGRPVERSSLSGQSVSPLSAHRGLQPVGHAAVVGGQSAAPPDRDGIAARSPHSAGETPLLQSTTAGRSLGPRPRRHLANAADQGCGPRPPDRAARGGRAVRLLASSGALRRGQQTRAEDAARDPSRPRLTGRQTRTPHTLDRTRTGGKGGLRPIPPHRPLEAGQSPANHPKINTP